MQDREKWCRLEKKEKKYGRMKWTIKRNEKSIFFNKQRKNSKNTNFKLLERT